MAVLVDTKKHFMKVFLASLLGLAAGFFLLEEVASWEKVPLGQTFYIIIGCVFIAVSGISLFVSLKTRFFPKKRKRRSKPIFLDEEKHKKRNQDQHNR